MTMAEMVAAVRAHAMKNYTKGGWDYIIETFEDSELAEIIGGSKTVRGAINKVAWHANLLGERRAEVTSTIW
jgi:hypothetical protein